MHEPALADAVQVELQNTLILDSDTIGLTGRVIFVRNDVLDQMGKSIETGTEIGIHDVLTVENGGFLSIELKDGRTLNIQPNTSTSIASALVRRSETFTINAPHAIGGVRG